MLADGRTQRISASEIPSLTRFLALLEEYRRAPEVTRRRLYLETMEVVLPDVDKVIILLTDGDTNRAQLDDYESLLAEMRSSEITITTIRIGDDTVGAVAAIGMIGSLHYCLWGQALSQEVADQREEEEVRERLASRDDFTHDKIRARRF